MPRIGALDLIERVVDPGSWRSWDVEPLPPRGLSGLPSPEYVADLAAARAKTGLDESIVTGQALIGGRAVAVVLGDFGFLAGSIGVAAAERLVLAIEQATAARLPLIAGPTSGGTRMQEGTVAFIQMVKISAAIAAHKAAKLPYLVYLRDPTTGGVLASWGSLGHLTAAQPGALIGFLGPRVYEALYDDTFPAGVQTAENLFAHGLVDAVVSPERLRGIAINALQVLDAPRRGLSAVADPPVEDIEDLPAWDSIVRSRRPERPGLRALLRGAARDVTPLQGTGEGERDATILLALARFGAAPCIVMGHDRRQEQGPMGPAGLREARRAMRLAVELGLPLVTVIDTAGAALSQAAEEGGLAGEIARCLAELTVLPAPTVCLLLGQGAGGGALALLPADRVICAQHGWLSPLPPEGASAIVHRTTDLAPQMAQQQGVRSIDLLRHGIVDRIVAEHPDASDEPAAFLRRMGAVLEFELTTLLEQEDADRLGHRLSRYRALGLPS